MSTALSPLQEQQHEAMDRLECLIAQTPEPETKLIHHFADGLYGRELHLPKGAILTGKTHRGRTLNIIPKGKIQVSAVGETPRIIEAPACFVSEAGTRRAGLALEDTIWINVHASEETDLVKLEAQLIEPHENPMLDYTTRRLKQ